MKLNNKGFAITAVLYGLLILFVILVSSYLLVLSAKKDRVDTLANDIEKEYRNDLECNIIFNTIEFPFVVTETGKYIFNITDTSTIYNCIANLEKDTTIEYDNGKLTIVNGDASSDLEFSNQSCNDINNNSNVLIINKITYNCN